MDLTKNNNTELNSLKGFLFISCKAISVVIVHNNSFYFQNCIIFINLLEF